MWGHTPYLGSHVSSGKQLPASVDWTTKGAVTPVMNQGKCGSCWTFSTTGALEGAWKIATGSLVAFSKQQFLDCDKDDNACKGGNLLRSSKFSQQNAICTEGSYEYKSGATSQAGKCMASSCKVGLPLGGITGWKSVGATTRADEQVLMDAVAMNPVTATIAFSEQIFKSYHSGVLTASSCGNPAFPRALNHAVLVVGYGIVNSTKYWLIKNSFGSTWGEKGYMKLLRGATYPGECGILSGQLLYPVVQQQSQQITLV
jgi:C1A family cysteine protease